MREISSRYSRGMSTPAIRAMGLLALPLLVTGVGADHHDLALATYHLAALTDLLDTRLYLHGCLLLVAVGNAPTTDVVRRQLHLHPVTRQDSDVVHPHLPGDVREHFVTVFQLDAEHGVGQRFDDRAFHHDGVFLGLGQVMSPDDASRPANCRGTGG